MGETQKLGFLTWVLISNLVQFSNTLCLHKLKMHGSIRGNGKQSRHLYKWVNKTSSTVGSSFLPLSHSAGWMALSTVHFLKLSDNSSLWHQQKYLQFSPCVPLHHATTPVMSSVLTISVIWDRDLNFFISLLWWVLSLKFSGFFLKIWPSWFPMCPFVYLTIFLLLESIQVCGSVYWWAQFLVIRHFLMELQSPSPFFTMVTVYSYDQWKLRVRFYHLLCHLIYEGPLPETVQNLHPTFPFTYQKIKSWPSLSLRSSVSSTL